MARVNYYLAIFIDLLGQGDKLAQIKDLPTTPEETEELIRRFRDTAGVVKTLHEDFESLFKRHEKVSPEFEESLKKFPSDLQEKFYESRKLNLKYLRFSDTVIIYFTLDRENNKTPMMSVFSALSATASTMLLMLARGIPLRGAINIGLGTEIATSGIYGPILHNLHYLESKVAQYPRIIVGNELMQMIEEYERVEPNSQDFFLSVNKKIIPTIDNLIKRDTDGKYFVHFLIKENSDALGSDSKKIYGDVSKFVDTQYRLAKDNDKLRGRYKLLKDYIRRNKSTWQ